MSKSETESVYEVPVKKKEIPILELDHSDSSIALFEKDKSDDNNEKSDSSEKSDSTTKLYKKFMEGDSSKISLPTVSSTFSTVAYSDSSSNDVKVLETDEEDLKKNISKPDIKVPETDDEDLKKNDIKVPETDHEDLKENSSKMDIKVPETDADLEKKIQKCISSVEESVIHDTEKVQKVVQGETPVNDKEKPNSVIPETEKVVTNITNEKEDISSPVKDIPPNTTASTTSSFSDSSSSEVQPTDATETTDIVTEKQREFQQAFGPQTQTDVDK